LSQQLNTILSVFNSLSFLFGSSFFIYIAMKKIFKNKKIISNQYRGKNGEIVSQQHAKPHKNGFLLAQEK